MTLDPTRLENWSEFQNWAKPFTSMSISSRNWIWPLTSNLLPGNITKVFFNFDFNKQQPNVFGMLEKVNSNKLKICPSKHLVGLNIVHAQVDVKFCIAKYVLE